MRIVSASVAFLCGTFLSVAQTNTILMRPYLQAVTSNSVYVLVESSTRDTVAVDFGSRASFGSVARTESIEETTNDTYVHNIKLTGLKPGQRYYYRARQDGNISPPSSFVTAVLPGTPFRFDWFADCRSDTLVHDQIVKRILDAHPAVSLYGGDLAARSLYSTYKSDFFITSQLTLSGSVPFFNAVGNHEGWSTNTRAFTQAPDSAAEAHGYYSFDYGDMHVLVLNTQTDCDEESAQFEFAKHDLAVTRRTWKIVIAHKHPYAGGGHGEDSDLKTMTTKIFEPAGVQLWLAGHSHFYQHNFVNGIHHLIIGTAGAPLYTPSDKPYTLKSVRDYNYAIGDVSPTVFTLMVFNNTGAVLDSLVLHSREPATQGTPKKGE